MTSFPYDFTPVLPAEYDTTYEMKEISAMIPQLVDPGYERLGPIGYVVKAGRRETIRRIQDLKVTEKDIWIVTYPRSGTTWTQEMIWHILNGLDFEGGRKIDIDQKFFFLDMDWLGPKGMTENISACEQALGQVRLIKTHLPLSLLPPEMLNKCRVVYVGRNPKDVAVSYYHHHRLTKSAHPQLQFPDFLKLFMANLLVQGPHLANVKEGLDASRAGRLLFLWYEDMKADLPNAIRTMTEYLETSLTEEQVTSLADQLSIKKMKSNPAVNHADRHAKGRFLEGESFVRKGEAGGWRQYFTEEMEKDFDSWLQKQECDITFKWE